MLEKVKFNNSPSTEVLNDKAKSKADKIDKWDNPCIKSCKMFIKSAEIKKVSPQTKKNEDLKAKVLDNAVDLFNEFYFIYSKFLW